MLSSAVVSLGVSHAFELLGSPVQHTPSQQLHCADGPSPPWLTAAVLVPVLLPGDFVTGVKSGTSVLEDVLLLQLQQLAVQLHTLAVSDQEAGSVLVGLVAKMDEQHFQQLQVSGATGACMHSMHCSCSISPVWGGQQTGYLVLCLGPGTELHAHTRQSLQTTSQHTSHGHVACHAASRARYQSMQEA